MPAMSAQYAMRRFLRASLAPRTKSRPSIGCAYGEHSLGPAIVCSISATSSAVRAIGPVTCSVSHTQSVGCVGTNPTDGRNPMTPQNAAGMRSDPPRSVPSASAIMPVASAAAPPPVDPPADFVVIPRISRASEYVVERVGAGRELRAVRLAENDRARLAKPADDERIFLRHVVCVDRRAERRAQPRDGRDVLDADGQPAERSRIVALLDPAIELRGIFERMRIQRDDGVERGVVLRDTLETGLDRFDDGHFPRRDPPPQLGCRQIGETHGVQSPTNATARQNAASPPLNFHGKHPRISRLFCSSGAAMSPPRFSMCMQSFGNSALCVS